MVASLNCACVIVVFWRSFSRQQGSRTTGLDKALALAVAFGGECEDHLSSLRASLRELGVELVELESSRGIDRRIALIKISARIPPAGCVSAHYLGGPLNSKFISYTAIFEALAQTS